MSAIEAGRQYFIPIPYTDTNSNWQQTRKIPVIHTELTIPNAEITITYLRFAIIPGKYSPLDILAGGENLEILGHRIRVQMVLILETSQGDMQEPNPPPGLALKFKEISQYFTPRNNGSKEQVG